jgi:aspartyl-tRNA(Asn)/glutamyl-tRNA(Gln) amidotransferase subunit A
MGSSNENSAYGPVKNVLDFTRVPGGSSGGSSTAVAGNLCTVALGSDTGGSIRQPASFTGTYGIKPTYGRISRYGLIAYASSFDQIGVFANTLEDTALVTQIMAGKDENDSTSSSKEVPSMVVPPINNKLRIAYLQETIDNEGIDQEVKYRMLQIFEKLRAEGHYVESVSFPYMEYMVPTYYVLSTAEASSNLSRFDGVHYGYRSKDAVGVEATYKKSRTEGFGPEVKRRIMAGTFVLSHGFYDAYYTKGQKVRRVLQNKTKEIFKNFDVVLTPTTPSSAFKLNDVKDPIQMYLQDIFTVHANLTGNPAISLPLGKSADGLPFGVQVMTEPFSEALLFGFSSQLEELLS